MPWSNQHKLSRGQCSVHNTSLAAVLQQTPCQQSHVPYGSRIDSLVRVHIRDCCWGDSEGFWQGSCLKLKVRGFRGDYRMLVDSLSICKYGWWRRLWSHAVFVLSPLSAEWGSEVYMLALIYPPYRFPQELNQIQMLYRPIVDGELSEFTPELEWHRVRQSFNGLVVDKRWAV